MKGMIQMVDWAQVGVTIGVGLLLAVVGFILGRVPVWNEKRKGTKAKSIETIQELDKELKYWKNREEQRKSFKRIPGKTFYLLNENGVDDYYCTRCFDVNDPPKLVKIKVYSHSYYCPECKNSGSLDETRQPSTNDYSGYIRW